MTDRKRLIRLAAGALLLTQTRAAKAVTRVVHDEAAKVAADADKRRDRKAAVLALLLLGSRAMVAALTPAIVDARVAARDAARRRLSAELRFAGVAIAAHQWVLGSRADEDRFHAQAAAESLASQWQGTATASVLLGLRKDVEPSKAVRLSADRMAGRIVRTTSTELAQAYSDEHRAATLDLVEHDTRFRDGEWADATRNIVDSWSAYLEACPACWSHDGEMVGFGEGFSGGDEPGHMHPHCACIRVTLPSAESEALAA